MKPDTHGSGHKGWIGVDLDATLAIYHGWVGAGHIGAPVEKMVQRVKAWHKEGIEVRIVTARVAPGKADREVCHRVISEWLYRTFPDGPPMIITHEKDQRMLELWDDRAVQVIPNTGRRADSVVSHLVTAVELIGVYILLAVMSRNSGYAKWARCHYDMHDYYDWEHGQPFHGAKEPCVRCGVKFGI